MHKLRLTSILMMDSSGLQSESQSPDENHATLPLAAANFGANEGESSRPLKRAKGCERKFLGVRQRPSERWVAEIKDSSQKRRLWLGTFDSAEEAALAYDSAARLLRGRNAKTNFTYHGVLTTHQPTCSLLGKNPRLYHLLQHAIMKNLAKSSSPSAVRIPWKDHVNGGTKADTIQFNTFVKKSIVCSSNSQELFGCCGSQKTDKSSGLSLGNSKVHASVIVAPTFSSSDSEE